MAESQLEKENLEAHVDLCAERYKFLQERLNGITGDIDSLGIAVLEIRDMLSKNQFRRQDQVMKWGMSAIGILLVVIGTLVNRYVL